MNCKIMATRLSPTTFTLKFKKSLQKKLSSTVKVEEFFYSATKFFYDLGNLEFNFTPKKAAAAAFKTSPKMKGSTAIVIACQKVICIKKIIEITPPT